MEFKIGSIIAYVNRYWLIDRIDFDRLKGPVIKLRTETAGGPMISGMFPEHTEQATIISQIFCQEPSEANVTDFHMARRRLNVYSNY